MICDRKSFDRDINDLLIFCSEHLPPGYTIRLSVVHGEADLSLYDNRDRPVGTEDYRLEGDHIDFWMDLLNEARRAEGLDPVVWPNQPEKSS